MKQELVIAEKDYDVFLPLATGPFTQFKSGDKWVEIRQDKGRWDHVKVGHRVLLRRGYSTQDNLYGTVVVVMKAESWFHLPKELRQGANVRDPLGSKFFDARKPVVAIWIDVERGVVLG